MATRTIPRRSVFGIVLEDLRIANGLELDALAQAMNATGFMSGLLSDVELAGHLLTLEAAHLGDSWPLGCSEGEFIDCLVQCLHTGVIAKRRFIWAVGLDGYAAQGA